MNEPAKLFLNGSAAIYLKIVGLAFQGLIVAGVFWVGATFERKSDFEAYKKEQDLRRMEDLRAAYEQSNLIARLAERLRIEQENQKPDKR
jgi:hypothetical protein